ncbi:hypothetical protein D9757_002044 [Collybiopsis confluens]|uniref:Histone H1 n=1 Tax=Collybiopsis confluens TaxID=2823264 RepID=A0A8H5HXN1_9AGAR|nr:hypothetical protein D9757_002044 [Collybiopsis confluens]
MAVLVSDLLVTDDLTILLGLIAGTVFLLRTFYRPQPLVHPILLGRQSEVARVRNPRESAVYRNYGTGLMNRFPVRPHKDVQVLSDLIRAENDSPRTLWNTKITNIALQDRVASFGTGFLRLTGFHGQESNVLLLLNDCIEFLITDLALSSHSIPSMTLTATNLLSPVLDTHPPSAIITHADFLPTLLELIYDAGEGKHHTLIVVGEPSTRILASVASNVKVLVWADVEREGFKVEKIMSPLPKPSDVFTVSYFSDSNGQIQGTQLTHQNLTSGVAGVHSLFPVSALLSSLDTIVSSHSLGSAYGRAIAYTAIFEGASFATCESSKLFRSDDVTAKEDVADVLSAQLYSIPSATILFIKPSHLGSLVEAIEREAQKNAILNAFAWRHKIAGINDGFVSKDTLWDRLVYDAARARVIGEGAGTVRTVIVGEGSLRNQLLIPARVAFSCHVMNVLTHPAVVGPIFASNALDLQDFSTKEEPLKRLAHVGPPTVSIEAKLVDVDDAKVEAGGDPSGILVVRGPPVGKQLSNDEIESASGYVTVRAGESGSSDNDDGWTNLGIKLSVQANEVNNFGRDAGSGRLPSRAKQTIARAQVDLELFPQPPSGTLNFGYPSTDPPPLSNIHRLRILPSTYSNNSTNDKIPSYLMSASLSPTKSNAGATSTPASPAKSAGKPVSAAANAVEKPTSKASGTRKAPKATTAKKTAAAKKSAATKPKPAAKGKAAAPAVAKPSWKDIIKVKSRWLLRNCIADHKDEARQGVSRSTIKKYAEEKYKLQMNNAHLSQLNRAISHGAETGIFLLPKGPSGKVKLPPKNKSSAESKENAKPPSKTVAKAPAKKAVTVPAKKTSAAPVKKVTSATKAKPVGKKATTIKAAPVKKPAVKTATKPAMKKAAPAKKVVAKPAAKKTTTAKKISTAKSAKATTLGASKAKTAAKKPVTKAKAAPAKKVATTAKPRSRAAKA